MISRLLRRVFRKPPTPTCLDRQQFRAELFASVDEAINRARSGLSARDLADHLERKTELIRISDSISRSIL